MRTVPRLIEMELLVEFLLLKVGQQQHAPAVKRLTIFAVHDGRRHVTMRTVIIEHGQGQLLQRSGSAIGDIARSFDDAEHNSAGCEHGQQTH